MYSSELLYAPTPSPPTLLVDHVRARTAQVVRCRDGGIVDVLRVLDPVTVAVDMPVRPRLRNQLHRPDRAVELGVAVELTPVAVGDERRLRTVERDADDGR
jgi:hypothetical protein